MLYLFTSYYTDKDVIRNNDLRTCLEKNIKNPLIDKIFLLSGEPIRVNNKKVVKINTEHYPTINDYYKYIVKNQKEGCITVIADGNTSLQNIIDNVDKTKNVFIYYLPIKEQSVVTFKPQHIDSNNIEFGYELLSVLPYAYKLFKEGKLLSTKSAVDTKCLYFFSPEHTESPTKRDWQNMNKLWTEKMPNIGIHRADLDWEYFEPPPFKEHYKNDRFIFSKPTVCIFNRINIEWDKAVINFFDIECLRKMFDLLKDKYQIIYFNIEGKKEYYDGVKPININDNDFIANNYPEIVTIHKLHQENPDLTFNELQLMIMANCEKFISMNGGYGILASFFGGTNIIYSKECREITPQVNSFYRWYHKLGGSRIIHTDTYEGLYEWIETVLVKEKPLVNVLVRTSDRPNFFSKCIESIKRQQYKNINIIVGTDNQSSVNYVITYKVLPIKYSPVKISDIPPAPNTSVYGIRFPYNSYLNELGKMVKEGWIQYLDDDDKFVSDTAVEKTLSIEQNTKYINVKDKNKDTFSYFNYILDNYDLGNKIIDLGTGHGKYAVICRDKGYDITAIDGRPDRIPFNEKSIKWIISDVSDTDLKGYDTVLCLGLLYHLPLERQIDFLKKIDCDTLIINTHTAIVENEQIKNTEFSDLLTYHRVNENIEGATYKECDSLYNLKNRPLAALNNTVSFWHTLDSLKYILLEYGGFNQIDILTPEISEGRTFIVARKVKKEDNLYLWKVNCSGKTVPSEDNFGNPPVVCNISGIGFMFHSKYLDKVNWTPYKRADYRVISKLYNELNPVWINEILTSTQQEGLIDGMGQKNDLQLRGE